MLPPAFDFVVSLGPNGLQSQILKRSFLENIIAIQIVVSYQAPMASPSLTTNAVEIAIEIVRVGR